MISIRKWREKRAAEREADEQAQRDAVLQSRCGQAKLDAGLDPFWHCPSKQTYSTYGPCRLGHSCGLTREYVRDDWEPAEEWR